MSRMAEFRLFLKLSPVEIAAKLGLSRQAYYQYENGLRKTPTEVMVKLASMGLNLNWLATGEGEMIIAGHSNDLVVRENVQYYVDRKMETAKEVMSTGRYPQVTADDLALADQWLEELVLKGREHDPKAKWEWIHMVAEIMAESRFVGKSMDDARAKVERLLRLAKGLTDND